MTIKNALPVHLIGRFPCAGADRAVEWTSVCHSGNYIFIEHHDFRDVGRWGCEERKRKYCVKLWSRRGVYTSDLSSHYTLEAAEKAAERWAKDFAK